jgi:hypothetical protein
MDYLIIVYEIIEEAVESVVGRDVAMETGLALE